MLQRFIVLNTLGSPCSLRENVQNFLCVHMQNSVLSSFLIHVCGVQCDPNYGENACDSGCSGGLMTSAFSYIQKAGGLQLEEDYPYKGMKGKCNFDASKVAAKVANFSTVVVDEEQIAANLVKNGPLASK